MPYLVNEFHDSKGFQPRAAQSYTHSKGTKPIRFEEIECVINGDSTVKGIKDGSDVFMPFSFIQKYFEVQMIQKRKMTMNCLYIYICIIHVHAFGIVHSTNRFLITMTTNDGNKVFIISIINECVAQTLIIFCCI